MTALSHSSIANWTAGFSQKLAFRTRLSTTAKKIHTLGKVVKKASTLFTTATYNNVLNEVHTQEGGFKNWVTRLSSAVTRAAGNFFQADQERHTSETRLARFGFVVGGALERETEHPQQRDQLIQQLMDAQLYRKNQVAQLDLLPAAQTAVQTARRPTASLEQTVHTVADLTKKLDELVSANTQLDHNDCQQVFYLRDRLYGEIQSYTQLKKQLNSNGGTASPEHQEFLRTHQALLERAVNYARWSNELNVALGLNIS